MASPDIVIEAASGLLFIVLGFLVLRIRPRRLANGVFALFLIVWGANLVILNMALFEVSLSEPLFFLSAVLNVVAVVALVWLALVFPRPLVTADKGAFVAAVIVGGAIGLMLAGGILLGQAYVEDAAGGPLTYGFLSFITTSGLVVGAHFYAIVLWSFRYLNVPSDDGTTRRQYALVAAALISFIGFLAGAGPDPSASMVAAIRAGNPFLMAYSALSLVTLAGVALIWLYAQHRRPDGHIGRNMAWFTLGVPLLGVLYSYMEPWGAFALTRVVAVVLLAIGILRFQLLSVDIRLRWAVSRSTIAAAFLGIFFVTTVTAENFLTDRYGWALGGIAAGALIFALAPLQRLADHLAATAVPGAGARGPESTVAEKAYRDAVRIAMADRDIDPEEEIQLAALADALGIRGAHATRIRNEIAVEKTRRG